MGFAIERLDPLQGSDPVQTQRQTPTLTEGMDSRLDVKKPLREAARDKEWSRGNGAKVVSWAAGGGRWVEMRLDQACHAGPGPVACG